MASSDYYWSIYKMFHNPPGTPQNLRCISCRYTVSGASFALMAASMFGVKKTIKNNVYIGTVFAFGTLICGLTGAIAWRSAIEDTKWNELRLEEAAIEMKKLRQERSQNVTQNA